MSSQFRASQRDLVNGIGRIDEDGHTSRSGHQLTQQFQPLCGHFDVEKIDTCQVVTRPYETGNKSEPDRVFGDAADAVDGSSTGT